VYFIEIFPKKRHKKIPFYLRSKNLPNGQFLLFLANCFKNAQWQPWKFFHLILCLFEDLMKKILVVLFEDFVGLVSYPQQHIFD
jgi:hypothetical protein